MAYPEVIKHDGTREAFDPSKLRASLLRARASEVQADEIVEHLNKEIEDGVTTEYIYKHAFDLLKGLDRGTAARYSLRRALAELGPSGYPFEQFVAAILETQGLKSETNLVLNGSCTEHEVDVLSYNEERFVICEAKFHNQAGIKTDQKVALYVHARFNDLAENKFDARNVHNAKPEAWIITNTKFTHNALRYGKCVGLTMIGWSYPKVGNLQDLIEEAGLEPVTALTTLTTSEKQKLLNDGVVMCKTLRDEPERLERVGIVRHKRQEVIDEVERLCS